jgi:hypothetical protein
MVPIDPFVRDSRGNRLASWTVTADRGGHAVWLRGPIEVVDQLIEVEPQYQEPRQPLPGNGWSHVVWSPDPNMRPEVAAMLDELCRVLSLPKPAGLDTAIALDWYKVPQEGVDSNSWPNTEKGELVYSGKYRYRFDPGRQRQAGLTLVTSVCEAVSAHAQLAASTIVLDIPGHDRTQVSFGSRLAHTVARERGLPFLKVSARAEFRPQAKELPSSERRAMLRDQFVVSERISGEKVLIVDDVFQSGSSAEAVAGAARSAGATVVNGIFCVRTLRR